MFPTSPQNARPPMAPRPGTARPIATQSQGTPYSGGRPPEITMDELRARRQQLEQNRPLYRNTQPAWSPRTLAQGDTGLARPSGGVFNVEGPPPTPTLHGGESPDAGYYYKKQQLEERGKRIPRGWQQAFPDIAEKMKAFEQSHAGKSVGSYDEYRSAQLSQLERLLAEKRREYDTQKKAYDALVQPWRPAIGRPGSASQRQPPRTPSGELIPMPAMPSTLLNSPFNPWFQQNLPYKRTR